MNSLFMEQFDGEQTILISIDTCNPLHIIPAMIRILRDITEMNTEQYSDEFTIFADYADSLVDSVSTYGYERLSELYETLFDALNDNAPEGYYFGADDTDPACLGFWPISADLFTEEGYND